MSLSMSLSMSSDITTREFYSVPSRLQSLRVCLPLREFQSDSDGITELDVEHYSSHQIVISSRRQEFEEPGKMEWRSQVHRDIRQRQLIL